TVNNQFAALEPGHRGAAPALSVDNIAHIAANDREGAEVEQVTADEGGVAADGAVLDRHLAADIVVDAASLDRDIVEHVVRVEGKRAGAKKLVQNGPARISLIAPQATMVDGHEATSSDGAAIVRVVPRESTVANCRVVSKQGAAGAADSM